MVSVGVALLVAVGVVGLLSNNANAISYFSRTRGSSGTEAGEELGLSGTPVENAMASRVAELCAKLGRGQSEGVPAAIRNACSAVLLKRAMRSFRGLP